MTTVGTNIGGANIYLHKYTILPRKYCSTKLTDSLLIPYQTRTEFIIMRVLIVVNDL